MLGSTKIYGCLADPIDHVKAPSIFSSIFKEKNIDAVMVPIHVEKNNLENVISSIKKIKNFEGMTVTIPHKTTVANLCDYLEPDAQFTQSVNKNVDFFFETISVFAEANYNFPPSFIVNTVVCLTMYRSIIYLVYFCTARSFGPRQILHQYWV